MVLPVAVAAALPIAKTIGAWALTVGPLIYEMFKGGGNDDEAAAKIAQSRDALAARLSQSEGISLAQATKMANEHLEPLIAQHAQEASSHGGAVASGIASTAGAFLLGRGRGLGKLAKGALGAEKAAVAAAPMEAKAAGGMLAHGAQSPTQAGAIEGVRDVGRLDSQIMASKKQGLPVISGKQEQALGGLADENRMTRGFRPNEEVPSARQREASQGIGIAGRANAEAPNMQSLDQLAAVEDVAQSERYGNMLAHEAGGMAEMEAQSIPRQIAGRHGMMMDDVTSQMTESEMRTEMMLRKLREMQGG